jgi:hypothetical protein
MAQRQCRSCKMLAPGGEIPVVERGNTWAEWHLCGRCWGLLVIGLRSHLRDQGLNPLIDLEGLRLRPRKVRAAIHEGILVLRGRSTQRQTEREEVLDEEQSLLAELEALTREVQETARFEVPPDVWRTLHQRLGHLRADVRELRQRYPGIEDPPAPPV